MRYKAIAITALYVGCMVVDELAHRGVPLGPLRRLGCPTGLGLRAARLEDRWGLTPPPGAAQPGSPGPRAAG